MNGCLMELKGKARSGSTVPAECWFRESPEGFALTYVTRREIARWAHTQTHTHTYRTPWNPVHVLLALLLSTHNAADANMAWINEWTNNIYTNARILYTHTYADTHFTQTCTLGKVMNPQGNQYYLGLKHRALKLWCDVHVPPSWFFLSLAFCNVYGSLDEGGKR